MSASQPVIEAMVALWAKGLSATQIGVEMGRDFPNEGRDWGRNAVIGLVHRLRKRGHNFPARPHSGGTKGRSGRPLMVRQKTNFPRPYAGKERTRSRGRLPPRIDENGNRSAYEGKMPRQKMSKYGNPLPGVLPTPIETFDQAFVASEGVTPKPLLELETQECHWPVGDDKPQLYCAAPVTKGCYCAKHSTS